MKVFIATDHAGFAHKETLITALAETDYEVVDCGAAAHNETDDYPDFVRLAAAEVAADPTARAIVLGGSGQGEAMVANRFKGVRAAVYYGEPTRPQVAADGQELSALASSRVHNDANVLSIGARFLTTEEVVEAVEKWLSVTFSADERHVRRIKKIDEVV